MVQILIKIDDKENVKEYSIIELQGDLETNEGESLGNKLLGDLTFSKDGTPIIIIGHHILYGKVITLDKPLVLLKKTKVTVTQPMDMDEDEQGLENREENTQTSVQYIVQAIIKRKILFNKRPRPIVVNDTKRAKQLIL